MLRRLPGFTLLLDTGLHRVILLFLCLLPTLPTAAMTKPIQIDGPDGPLAGKLVVAEDASDILVIIPGSGPIDKDGNAATMGLRSDLYKLLAEGLKAAGISSLRIDKRGLHESAEALSDPNDVTIGAYAEDAARWVERASAVAPCVWLAGHSEGGLVALAAARKRPKHLCGLILMATSGRPTGQLLLEQLRANPANAPLMTEIEAVVADLEAGRRRDPETLSPVLKPLFADMLQRYMIDLFSYDPVVIAKTWHGPALILQGDADRQVKLRDAEVLADAMPQAIRIDLPGGTHLLKRDVPGDPMASYRDPALPLHPDLIPAILQLLERARGSD